MTQPPAAGPPCPICGKPPIKQFRPFCCARCADVDLGRWFGGAYQVPGGPADEEPSEDDED